MSDIEILKVGITEQKGDTWGRIYVDYIQDGVEKYIFRNYIHFEEKNYQGLGSFEKEVAFAFFRVSTIEPDYRRVIEGEHDNNLVLTQNPRYKKAYGTPSTLLQSLLDAIDKDLGEDVRNRRGWFNK